MSNPKLEPTSGRGWVEDRGFFVLPASKIEDGGFFVLRSWKIRAAEPGSGRAGRVMAGTGGVVHPGPDLSFQFLHSADNSKGPDLSRARPFTSIRDEA